jgi:hypothetical protein
LGYPLVRFADVLDAMLERFTFWRQFLIARSALTRGAFPLVSSHSL